jgi:uncharacterized protein YggU (UPF0235/DUF167 family)
MYVRVVAYPGSKKEKVTCIGEQRYEIMVKEPAKQNLANNRIRALVAQLYGKAISETRIISGHQTARKIISVSD